MVQAEGNLDRKVQSQVTLTEAAIKALTLTDADGTNTICAVSDANSKEYAIAAAGAGTYYAYIDIDEKLGYELIGYDVCCDASVSMVSIFQQYKGGAYRTNAAYSLAATDSEEVNPAYPLRQGIYRRKSRIAVTVDGACNIYIQAIQG